MMNYPPLCDVRKSFRVKWYRCPIDTKLLHQLLTRSDLQGFAQAGGHFALWLLTGTLVYLFWLQQAWVALALMLILHGTISSFFVGVAPHELGHGTVFRTPLLNRLFLYLFCLISWWDPFDYSSSHTYHHRYTLHPKGDRENLLPLAPNTGPGFLLQMCTINLFTQKGRTFGKGGLISTIIATANSALGKHGDENIPRNEWLLAIHTDQPEEFRRSIIWSRILLAFHGGVIFFSLVSGQWIFIVIVSVACFIANLLSYLVGMTQHCGLKQNDPDFRKCTRSIVLDPVTEFLYWRMNWHTEHHMYAGVPCYNLKKLHYAVQDDMPEPRTLRQAWQEMRDTWQQQKSDEGYFFDTPLPVMAGAATKSETPAETELQADAELAESIGDLAPKGLRK